MITSKQEPTRSKSRFPVKGVSKVVADARTVIGALRIDGATTWSQTFAIDGVGWDRAINAHPVTTEPVGIGARPLGCRNVRDTSGSGPIQTPSLIARLCSL